MPSLLYQFKISKSTSTARQKLAYLGQHSSSSPLSTVIGMATEWPSDLWVHMNVIVMFVVSTLDATLFFMHDVRGGAKDAP
jgi:hypothetical protein